MNKIKLTKRSAVAILLVLAIILIGIVSLRTVAEANDDVLLASSVYSQRLEKIHWVADALRSLGFENGSKIQQAALKQCGDYWHEQNNLRKQALAKEEEARKKAEEERLANKKFWATAQMTAYEWSGLRCANGNWPTVGYTVACNTLPLGTHVWIEGIGERVVEDRGASWHDSNWMDLYLGDVAACNEFGVQYPDVYIIPAA